MIKFILVSDSGQLRVMKLCIADNQHMSLSWYHANLSVTSQNDKKDAF